MQIDAEFCRKGIFWKYGPAFLQLCRWN